MAYTDPDGVRVALTPGGDDADVGSAASMSDDDLLAAIADATDEVNAKLSGRYQVPFTDPAPSLVVSITIRIAAYLATLTDRRGDPIQPGDPVLLGYQRAEMLLGQLQSGAATLDGSTSPAPSAGAGPVVTNLLTGALFDVDDFFCDPAPTPRWL